MMNISHSPTDDTLTYWNLIKNVSDEVKLRLISKLSESLISHRKETNNEKTEEFLSRFYGAWKGDETAEEILSAIKENRSCKDPISFE